MAASMTARERILGAIEGVPIDRVPVVPFIHANYVREFFGDREVDCVEKTIEVYDAFGFDAIHRNCTPAYDDIDLQGENWKCSVEHRPIGERDEDIVYRISTPEGELSQVLSLRWICEWDCEFGPVEYLLKTEQDLDLVLKYQPPVGRIDTECIGRANAVLGTHGVTAPWIQGVFNQAGYLYRALGELAIDPLVRPDFYRRMMEHSLERELAISRQFIEAGADFLSVGINIASGTMFDSAFCREYVLPYEKRLFEGIRAMGGKTIAHNCGCAGRLMSMYRDMGMTVYESMTPPPHGDTRIEQAIEELGPYAALMGGVDQIDLLRTGTPEDIGVAVRAIMDAAKGRCRFLLGTSDYFNENTPPENLHALARAGQEFGGF